jgi:hypothetical protein
VDGTEKRSKYRCNKGCQKMQRPEYYKHHPCGLKFSRVMKKRNDGENGDNWELKSMSQGRNPGVRR